MRILFIHGWLMNERSLTMLGNKFARHGHECVYYSIPGLAYKPTLKVKWDIIVELFQDFLKDNDSFDIIIAHSMGCTLTLAAHEYIGDAKLVLLSPLCNNATSSAKKLLKYLPLLYLGKTVNSRIVSNLYFICMNMQKYSSTNLRNISNGFYTCKVKAAVALLKSAMQFKFQPRGKLDNELIVVTGDKDILVTNYTDNIESHFNFSVHIYKDCGHDTFNYLKLSEVL